jgi:hypothetical protein
VGLLHQVGSSSGSAGDVRSGHGSPPTCLDCESLLVGPVSAGHLHKEDTRADHTGGMCDPFSHPSNGRAEILGGDEGTLYALQQQQQPQHIPGGGGVLTAPCQISPSRNNHSSSCSRVACSPAGGNSSSSNTEARQYGLTSGPSVESAGGRLGTCVLRVCGLALLHPVLSGQHVPALTRLLSATSLGRSIIRPLLRSEVRHRGATRWCRRGGGGVVRLNKTESQFVCCP